MRNKIVDAHRKTNSQALIPIDDLVDRHPRLRGDQFGRRVEKPCIGCNASSLYGTAMSIR
jgi:hypothetical protein